MQNKIIAAIANWIDENEGNLKACAIISDHKDEIAEEIYKAIAPLLPGYKDLEIGTKVEVIAKLGRGDEMAHSFEIGRVGKITAIDENDDDLSYKIDGLYWVSRSEIKPV